jgi:SAM-dependent methyltransferase
MGRAAVSRTITMFDRTAEVYRHYIEEGRAVIAKGGRILKTDCYNEMHGRPVVKPREASLIDIDRKLVSGAVKDGHDAHYGDIREIPFEDASFDAVLDFSTLDHIPSTDVPKAIGEYARVLKPDGTLLLFVWTCGGPSRHSAGQSFFSRKDVEKPLARHFDIESEADVFYSRTERDAILRRYAARRRAS